MPFLLREALKNRRETILKCLAIPMLIGWTRRRRFRFYVVHHITSIMRSVALCGVVSSERWFCRGFGLAALHIIPREEPRRLGGRAVAAAVGQRDQTRV